MKHQFALFMLAGLTVAAEEKKDGGKEKGPSPYDILDDRMARLTILVLGCIAAFVYIWQLATRFSSHIRRLASLNNDRQRFFLPPDMRIARLKEHLLYAPLFRTRHNREFQLSRAVGMGTLPSRFHSLLLFGLLVMNVVLCVVTVPYPKPQSTVAGVLRNRTGTIATINLIPLLIMAGRNNPLIPLLRVSFDTWNLLHRWLARIVVLEAVAHMLFWMVDKVQEEGGWAVVQKSIDGSSLITTGLVAVIAFVALMLHSFSALRHAFYETFLHVHILLVIAAMGFLWVHLKEFPQQSYVLVALIAWGLERFTRFAILLYRNLGNGATTAVVEALPGDCMRITLKMARPWRFQPGQHMYLYVPSVGLWTSHPFSVAWSQAEEIYTDEKGLVQTRQDVLALQKATISLLVRRRTGFTDKLYQRAERSVGGKVALKAFAEGPYGSIHTLDSYGTVLMFAGGVGITHHVPFIRHLVAGHADGTVAARRVTLVWVIQSPEHLEWIRPWMTSILGMERRRDVLRILLFITRPRNTREIQSPSATVQMYPGRPNIGALVDMEVESQIGAMGVMVCGSGSLSDDVRRVCRKRQTSSHIDYIEESFSW
ncbi:hypothetical protein DTO027B5_237 [Paecilomyces variotii]|nr:hypothetical protein DTO027B3_2523 [Paecilomyces variotii]KAJ9338085.1 hypothetical protein DTO027B5_237 [Paecilomyces variotii]